MATGSGAYDPATKGSDSEADEDRLLIGESGALNLDSSDDEDMDIDRVPLQRDRNTFAKAGENLGKPVRKRKTQAGQYEQVVSSFNQLVHGLSSGAESSASAEDAELQKAIALFTDADASELSVQDQVAFITHLTNNKRDTFAYTAFFKTKGDASALRRAWIRSLLSGS
ncbi:hypothetical protein OC846_002867 [Tilletia horrida]|uniref:Uncharacterized protein n=1 Tax=Tilletia horrida TaxID=155126 RepID=A0AAN6GW37_9BASI|nr:hypothetical protein OC846_002867 [Tilletia horrida]